MVCWSAGGCCYHSFTFIGVSMKTQEDLYLEYARVITMVREYNDKHGTDVKAWECVKNPSNGRRYSGNPNFFLPVDDYTFAIAILEGKPVFVGDKIYSKETGMCITVMQHHGDRYLRWESMSWTPPQKKPILEGREIKVNDVIFRNEDNPVPWIATETGVQSVKIIGTLSFDQMDLSEWSRLPTKNNIVSDEHIRNCIWPSEQKKRTFMLNGEELPCPLNEKTTKNGTEIYGLPINLPTDSFWFSSREDRDMVNSAILKVLSEARDKG